MSEWTVVVTLVTLVGLGAAIIKPIVSLNGAIVKLTHAVGRLDERINENNERNRKAHDAIFEAQREMMKTISNHEARLCAVESKPVRHEQNTPT